MSTVGELLNKTKVYRSNFTDVQIVNWMDTVQRQIYQDVPHEAIPYYFFTIEDNALYALPSDCDPRGVKQVNIESKTGSEKYKELRFISVESTERISEQSEFYSVASNQNLYINPTPTSITQGKKVFIIYNKRPAAISSADLTAVPDLDIDFHELIELGAKARVARERGEIVDKNNFEADFNILFAKYKDRYSIVYPEYPTIKDTMPRRRSSGRRSDRYSTLVPER